LDVAVIGCGMGGWAGVRAADDGSICSRPASSAAPESRAGVALALATIVRSLRFQAARIEQLANERGRR